MYFTNALCSVARSTVTSVTDPSNESRAYGIMGSVSSEAYKSGLN